jgi:flagellar assembly protein FliH
MSSSSDHRPSGATRGRILRGGVSVAEARPAVPAVLQRDLGSVADTVRAWNPEQVAAALAQGYRDGHDKGLDAGYAEGLAQGRAEAHQLEAERQANADAACTALRVAADELRQRHVAAVAAVEEDLVDAVIGITEALLGRELRSGGEAVVEAIGRGLALAAPDKPAVARLHPDDAAALLPVDTTFAPGASATWEHPTTGRAVQLVGDPSVLRGSCVVDAGDASIDAGLGPALARVRAALLGLDVVA